jgi:predicted DNA-binding protein (MmcQ/YjbR family)
MSPKAAFKAIRAHCLAKAGAFEDYPWGDVIWKVKGKIFAGGDDESTEVTVKATPTEQARLVRKPGIRVADYVGRFGWVTITVSSAQQLALTKKLIDQSYASIVGGSKRPSAKPGRKQKKHVKGETRSRRRE